MYILMKQFKVREELLDRKMRIFTPSQFSQIFGILAYKTKYYLEKWTREGFLVRLKQGLYGLKSDLPSEEEIANRLYMHSYLSFEYALAYYNILPEMPYVVTSATTKPTRNLIVGPKTFVYFKIKQQAYTGYVLTKIGEKSFLIADPQKALVDYLYFVALGKKPIYDRLDISSLSKEKILAYAKLYGRFKLDDMLMKLI